MRALFAFQEDSHAHSPTRTHLEHTAGTAAMTTRLFGIVIAACMGAVVICTAGLGLLSGHAATCTDPAQVNMGPSTAPQIWTTAGSHSTERASSAGATVSAGIDDAGRVPASSAVTGTTPAGFGAAQCTADRVNWTIDEPEVAPADYRVPAGTSPAAAIAITWALAQLGTPYRYGGDCTDAHAGVPTRQCDCSSLVQIAYRHAGVDLPRTTSEQVHAGIGVPAGQIAAGDLVFIPGSGGTRSRPGHVGMYLGSGLIIQAPHTGDVVKISPLSRWHGQIAAVRRVTE